MGGHGRNERVSGEVKVKGKVRRKDWERERRVGEKDRRVKKVQQGEGKWVRIVFWNVAGFWGKEEDFWRKLERWDVIVMMETWVERKVQGEK